MTSPAASTIPDIASDFGLIGWLEDQRVRLPLKGIEARFRVCGGLVEVELDQIYHQDNRSALNCQYLFPLPATAAIYRCELHINDRLLVAKAMEREDAIELVNEKKAAGHRTALVESERRIFSRSRWATSSLATSSLSASPTSNICRSSAPCGPSKSPVPRHPLHPREFLAPGQCRAWAGKRHGSGA